jgi:Bifunctional DNA primase/polymerase, N-terminal
VTALRQQLLVDALAAAERGWHVFPLLPNDKRPVITQWESRATTDRRVITNCWAAGPFNIGIACGPSRLVVVDLDVVKPGFAVPPEWAHRDVSEGRQVLNKLADDARQPIPAGTFSVATGSGGRHLYFTPPAGESLRNSAGRLGWLVDTRANGGCVVAAGSVVAGRAYRVLDHRPPAPLPNWIAAALRPNVSAPARTLTAIGQHSRYAAAALRKELDRVLAAEPGTRNHTLNAAAYSLGQLVATGLLSKEFTAAALHRAGAAIGLPDRETAATVRSGLNAGAKHPRALSS